jgi:hypothetical protein
VTTTSTTFVDARTGNTSSDAIAVTSSLKEEFILVNESGTHYVELVDAFIYLENGRTVTAFWGIRRRKEIGDYFLFLDHTMNRRRKHHIMLPKMLAPRKYLILPAAAFGFLIGSSSDLLSNWLPQTNGMLRGLVAGFIAGVGAFVAIVAVSHWRAKRFVREDATRLLKLVEDSGALQTAVIPTALKAASNP